MKSNKAIIVTGLCLIVIKLFIIDNNKDEKAIVKKIENRVGKKSSDITDQEIDSVLRLPDMAEERKSLAIKVYSENKDLIKSVFQKFDMKDRKQATDAYNEILNAGIKKVFMKDIRLKYKEEMEGKK